MRRIKITTRLVAALVAVALAACLPLLWIMLSDLQRTEAAAIRAGGQAMVAAAERSLSAEASRLETLIQGLVALEGLAAAVARNDRSAVGAELDPIHAALKTSGITALAITRPPATVLYRTNKPDLYNDDVSGRRPDLVSTQTTGKTTFGFTQQSEGLGLSFASPLMRGQDRVGVLSAQMGLGSDFFRRLAVLTGADVVVHAIQPNGATVIGGTLPRGAGLDASTLRAAFETPFAPRIAELGSRPVLLGVLPLRSFDGTPTLAIELLQDRTAKAAAQAAIQRNLLLTAGLVVLAAMALAVILGRGVAMPIRALITAASGLAAGNVAPIPGVQRGDELGTLARALDVLRANTARMRALEDEAAAIREHQANARQETIQRTTEGIEQSVGAIVTGLAGASSNLLGSTTRMEAAMQTVLDESGGARSAGDSASADTQAVAAAAEQLSASIAEITRQVAGSTTIVQQARSEAETSTAAAHSLDGVVADVEQVVRLIAGIAARTKLLALNASIEAARAGDAGKGFSVVAEEVKSLASQTADATETIEKKIIEIQRITRQNVTSVSAIGQTVTRLDDVAGSIAAAVEQQSSATAEIAQSIERAADGTRRALAAINRVATGIDDAGRVANDVRTASDTVAEQSGRLRHAVNHFTTQLQTV